MADCSSSSSSCLPLIGAQSVLPPFALIPVLVLSWGASAVLLSLFSALC